MPMKKYISTPAPHPAAVVPLQSGHSWALGTAMADSPLHGGETRVHGVARWQVLSCHHQPLLHLYQHDPRAEGSQKVREGPFALISLGPVARLPSGPSVCFFET